MTADIFYILLGHSGPNVLGTCCSHMHLTERDFLFRTHFHILKFSVYPVVEGRPSRAGFVILHYGDCFCVHITTRFIRMMLQDKHNCGKSHPNGTNSAESGQHHHFVAVNLPNIYPQGSHIESLQVLAGILQVGCW